MTLAAVVFALASGLPQQAGNVNVVIPHSQPQGQSPIGISFVTTGDGQLHIALANTTDKPVSFNLGCILGNGDRLAPTNLTLLLHNGDTVQKKKYQLGLSGVAGRVDDYIVPLAPHGYYQFSVKMMDFVNPLDMSIAFPTGPVKIALKLESTEPKYVNNDMEGVKLMKLWKGEVVSEIVEIKPVRE